MTDMHILIELYPNGQHQVHFSFTVPGLSGGMDVHVERVSALHGTPGLTTAQVNNEVIEPELEPLDIANWTPQEPEISDILAFMQEMGISYNNIPNSLESSNFDETMLVSQEDYKKMPARRFKKADVKGGFCQANCVICSENFKSNQKIPILPCKHDFHWKCLEKWVTKQKKTCPLCKKNIC